MLGFDLTGTNASIAMLVIVTITFIQFIREKQPPEVVAIGSAAAMLVLGLLPAEDAAGSRPRLTASAILRIISFPFLHARQSSG